MNKYKVTCSNIEWDVATEDYDDEHDPKVIAALPKQASITICAPDKTYAKEWGMNEISDNHSFCITSCKITIKKLSSKRIVRKAKKKKKD